MTMAFNASDSVTPKLSGDRDSNNYEAWKEQMLCLVESQGLLGFLHHDGEEAPSPLNDGLASLKGWILESLSEEILEDVVDLDSARDVWMELENKFAESESARPPPPPEQEEDWNEHLELYKAAVSGDWDTAEVILKRNPAAIKARVAFTLETALHIAVGSAKSASFVEKLVQRSDEATLAITDGLGFNVLHVAAGTGNLEAAKLLVKKSPDLLYVSSHVGNFPVHSAAQSGHRNTLELLISHTRDDLLVNPYAHHRGLLLLCHMIDADFLDLTLDLIKKYPHLARIKPLDVSTALNKIAGRDKVFAQLNFWERLLHSCIQVEKVEYSQQAESFDNENQKLEPPRWRQLVQELHSTLSELIKQLVPSARKIGEKKLMRKQAIRLVECICKEMVPLSFREAEAIYIDAMLTAARLGNHEVVEEIVATFPPAIYVAHTDTEQNFLHLAIRNRCEKVFNLVYQSSNHRFHYSYTVDSDGNSILHSAAFLAPTHKLNLVSGPALQMQRELQWFKAVYEFTSLNNRGRTNNANRTPQMIFTEEHRELKVEGERWMKDTANSCTITAALIATVVFAAAITVPGGNQSDTGYPMMWRESAFTIFAVSDAASLFTSITSLLVFLSILTSRYAEEDFLYALPKRLCIGLLTLFLSISLMMVAFSSTLYIVFGRMNPWILLPVAALTCLPISSFVLLQFPLLIAVVSSTYGKGIFGKQSDRPFH